MHTNGHERQRFGDFEFDFAAGKLWRNGQPVKIQPQPLRVLEVLLSRSGEIVSRDELRSRVWGDSTFVEFDQALNYSIRQIRLALGDEASKPDYIETLPKQGYRFIAIGAGSKPSEPHTETATPSPPIQRLSVWNRLAVAAAALFALALVLYLVRRSQPRAITYTQLTDFTDSAVAPALSPDGRMLAFIRGAESFLSADQVYVKILPDGEPRRLTDDPRMKYNLAFSPDGSQIAYTVLDSPTWSTYVVSVLGGDSHLLLKNAAGLSWLDQNQLLFSQVRSGVHLGVVTATVSRDHLREIYFPPHERGMVHYSFASPDRRFALVVQMTENGSWGPCLVISLTGPPSPRTAGPNAACTSAGWSPDGRFMYFVANVQGVRHLWRQRFPQGELEQITFGPSDDDGLAVSPDGRSVVTSLGVHESAIWIHDADGDRPLSSEGEVAGYPTPPRFNANATVLYYLLRRPAHGPGTELWRAFTKTGQSESLFPSVSMTSFDVSLDGQRVLYSVEAKHDNSQIWLAPIDHSVRARPIGPVGCNRPYFGKDGKILFSATDGRFNYLEQMNQDGSGISKVVPYPIDEIQSVSPRHRWIIATIPFAEGHTVGVVLIPSDGGPSRRVCSSFCVPVWSSDGKYLIVPVRSASRADSGRSLAVPLGQDESIPPLPDGGIDPDSQPAAVPGSTSIPRADLVPGDKLDHYAYVNTTVHHNLYRVSLP